MNWKHVCEMWVLRIFEAGFNHHILSSSSLKHLMLFNLFAQLLLNLGYVSYTFWDVWNRGNLLKAWSYSLVYPGCFYKFSFLSVFSTAVLANSKYGHSPMPLQFNSLTTNSICVCSYELSTWYNLKLSGKSVLMRNYLQQCGL